MILLYPPETWNSMRDSGDDCYEIFDRLDAEADS